MSLLKSAINQVGRDMGKVVSNQLFKDSHSTPYRRTDQTNVGYRRVKEVKTKFQKALDFDYGARPSTLISRLNGAFIELKNEVEPFLEDGYLDTEETDALFSMMEKFNSSIENVADALEIDEEGNAKEIEQLTLILKKSQKLFSDTLNEAAIGAIKEAEIHEGSSVLSEKHSFWKFVGLNMIWMGKFARTGNKKMFSTVAANILDIISFTWVLTRPILFFDGILSYRGYSKGFKKRNNAHLGIAEAERKRAEVFLNVAGND